MRSTRIFFRQKATRNLVISTVLSAAVSFDSIVKLKKYMINISFIMEDLDLDGDSARFVKITRRSSLTIGLRNITNKTVMFKVHSNPRAGSNYPLSGLLLPGEQNNYIHVYD